MLSQAWGRHEKLRRKVHPSSLSVRSRDAQSSLEASEGSWLPHVAGSVIHLSLNLQNSHGEGDENDQCPNPPWTVHIYPMVTDSHVLLLQCQLTTLRTST